MRPKILYVFYGQLDLVSSRINIPFEFIEQIQIEWSLIKYICKLLFNLVCIKKYRIGIFHRGIAPNDIQSICEVRFMFICWASPNVRFLRCIFNDWNYKRICTASEELGRRERKRESTKQYWSFFFHLILNRVGDVIFFLFKIKYKTKRILINSNPSPSIKIAIYEMQAANNNNDDDETLLTTMMVMKERKKQIRLLRMLKVWNWPSNRNMLFVFQRERERDRVCQKGTRTTQRV